MAKAAGAYNVGLRIAPEMNFNDVSDENAVETYTTLLRQIENLELAYLHVTRFQTEIDYHALLKPIFKGAYLAGGGLNYETATEMLETGVADAAVFGELFIANPDLPERFRQNTSLNTPDHQTYYSGGAEGYIDYHSLPN
jgi:N-ethylmaleimide reductase